MFKKLEECVSNVPYIRLGSFLLFVMALIVLFTIETRVPGILFFIFLGLFLIVEGLHRSGVWSGWKFLIDWGFPDDFLRIKILILVKKFIIFVIRLQFIVIGLYFGSFGLYGLFHWLFD